MRIYKIRNTETGYSFWSVYAADMIPDPNEVIVQVDELHDYTSARRFAAEILTMVEMLEADESQEEDSETFPEGDNGDLVEVLNIWDLYEEE
tara:strand:- start:15006 stop:15281 length:276 start_codon:yes stop_codon:yes gene_type:complete